MIHLKTVIFSFLLACLFLYVSMMFTYHSTDNTDKDQASEAGISRRPSIKPSTNSLRILTATRKRRPPAVTIPASKATFIMWEARQISDHFGLVFWTLINSAYVELTQNWLCQTSTMTGIHERVFVVTTDEESASTLRSRWPLVSILSLKLSAFNSSLTWGQQQYTDFLVLRASIIRLFVDSDVRFVLFETDSVWIRNPYEYFVNYSRTADIVLPKKYRSDTRGRNLTFDPMIVLPNGRSKKFFFEFYQRLVNPEYHSNGTLYDQDVVDDMCTSGFADVRCRTFPWSEIADGHWFKLSEQKRSSLPTYVVNNNFYSGIENKITRQALHGFWYLTFDHQCSNETLRKRTRAKRGAGVR